MIPTPDQLTTFVAWVGRSSLQACVLIGLIIVIQAALRDKPAPRWRHGLWMLLLIRLALPWTPESSFSIYNLFPRSAVSAMSEKQSKDTRSLIPTAPADGVAVPLVHVEKTDSPGGKQPIADLPPPKAELPAVTEAAVPMAPGKVPPQKRSLETVVQFIPLAWLIGAVALTVCTIVQYLGLVRIRRQRLLTDQKTLDLLEDCKEQMGIRTYLAVVETDCVKSPSLFGFVRPRLLLPVGTVEALGPEQLRHVFLHELAHLKRHDIGINWVIAVLQILHWFNPLIWYAFHRMRADRELACDALALSRARPGESPQYGRTIIHLLEMYSRPHRLPVLAGIMENKSQLRRRITMIG